MITFSRPTFSFIPGDPAAIDLATIPRDGGLPPIRPRAGWSIITPTFAEALLSTRQDDISINPAECEAMSIDMASGAWKTTGEPIIISSDGHLIDGRKRLLACSHAKTPFVCLILLGVTPAAVDNVNTLRARKLSDVLMATGESNHRSLASALEILWHVRKGPAYDETSPMGTDSQLLEMLNHNREIIVQAMAMASNKGRHLRIPLFASFYIMATTANRYESLNFFKALLEDGNAITNKQPAKRLPLSLAARLLNDTFIQERAMDTGLDLTRKRALGICINAFNAYLSGLPAKSLDYKVLDEETGEHTPFPTLNGWTGLSLGRQAEAGQSHVAFTERSGAAERHEGDIAFPQLEQTADPSEHRELWTTAWTGLDALPTVDLKMVGPTEARNLLAKNFRNRSKLVEVIHKYARDMKAGDWLITGQTCKIASNGRLLDSQHRMEAVVEANVRVPFIFVTGLAEDSFAALDRGETLTYSAVLRRRGIPSGGLIASIVRLQFYYEENRFSSFKTMPSNAELDSVLARNPDIKQATIWNNRCRDLLIPGATGWLETHIRRADPGLCEDFFGKLTSAVGIDDIKNAALVLRRKLEAGNLDRLKTRSTGKTRIVGDTKEEQDRLIVEQMAVTITAFNNYAKGNKIAPQLLVWRGLAAHGGFPEIDIAPDEPKVPGKRGRPRKSPQPEGATMLDILEKLPADEDN